jgi:hypothetical protein
MRMRVYLAVLMGAATVLGAGCGSSENSSSSSPQASTPGGSGSAAAQSSSARQSNLSKGGLTASRGAVESPYTKAIAAAEASAPSHLSGEAVAIVNGAPITKATYDRWLEVSAPATVKPLIANPSDYSGCISALKSREQAQRKLIKESEERYAKSLKGRKAPASALGARKARTDAQYKEQCEQQYKSERLQAIRTLINQAWTQGQAKELGVSVSEAEVAKRLKTREEEQKRLAKNSRYAEFAGAEASYSKADLKEVVSNGLLEERVAAKTREQSVKPGSVSQEKLEKYFTEHKQFYAQPEQRMITYAALKSKSAAEAVATEHGGLAAAASKHGIKATSTSVGCEQARSGTGGLVAKICAAKAGVISGPVTPTTSAKAATLYYVFEVKSITAATKPSFAQVKERIKQTLSSQGESQAMVKHEEETREKWKASTECAKGYVVELCKEYVMPKPIVAAKAHKP